MTKEAPGSIIALEFILLLLLFLFYILYQKFSDSKRKTHLVVKKRSEIPKNRYHKPSYLRSYLQNKKNFGTRNRAI